MRTLRLLTTIVTLALTAGITLHAQDATTPQSWTASDGRVMQAKFIRLDGESVVIEKDGEQFAVPFAKLNADSVALAKKLGGVPLPAEPDAALMPEPLIEPLELNALLILPDGGLMATGGTPGKDHSFLWKPDTKKWEPLEPAGMWGELAVSPLNEEQLCISGRDVFVSKDGGKTWKQAAPQMNAIGGKHVQIGHAFWSIKKPDTLLLAQIEFDTEAAIFELELDSGKISPLSKTEIYTSRYERVGEKHFGWLGSYDGIWGKAESKNLIKCVVSEDDGKTWKPVEPEQTPWALYASVQAQVEKLVTSKDEHFRPAASWAVDIDGIAICRIECVVGCKIDSSSTIFTSQDHGKTWVPAPLDKRTADIRTIFAESPFITKDAAGKPIIDSNKPLELRFDSKTQRIFAGLEGEWFVTTPTDREWHRINKLPK